MDEFIRPEQFGFRREHSTTLQLVRVITQLTDAAKRHLSTGAVLLDVSKAFDKVWHEGILFKLSQTPTPFTIVHFLRSYHSDRTFMVSVEGANSRASPVAAGVPQGSILGSVLYLGYRNDLHVYPGVTLSLFADDAMFYYTTLSPGFACVMLQRQLDLLPGWLNRWRMAINSEKSEAL